MSPEALNDIVELLKTGGPWTLVVLMGWWIWKQDKRMVAMNDKLFAMMERKIEVDVKHEQAFTGLRAVIEALINKL